MEIALRGIAVSPGIAIGPALTFKVRSLEIPKYKVTDRDGELQRFDAAVAAVREDLERVHRQTAEVLGDHHANIFKAHLMLLDDVTMRQEIEGRLKEEQMNVEYLLDDFVNRYAELMRTVRAPSFRERNEDFLDVGTRVLRRLLNAELISLEHIESPSVVVAHELSPSDTANIDTENALGIVTDVGGPTSHTAILARALEIPAVVGVKYIGAHVALGDLLIVDGTNGQVFIRPDEATLQEFTQEKERLEKKRKVLLAAEEDRPITTVDGHEMPTLVNIELPIEISHSLKVRVQGIGLYRTEYLFLNRPTLPTEEEQFQAYSQAAAAFKPWPVTLRTLDLGGDKFASAAQLPVADEINPQLGWRAVRFCLQRPDIFKAQLRAMLRASVHGAVQIMFPMIGCIEELRQVKAVVDEVAADLDARGVPYAKGIKVGSMIEVPSAVIVADALAKECDFFSIGTNDLIQYSLAVDRVNEKIAHLYEPAHPAILRMIRQTIRAAKAAHIPCSICGEMAGDPLFTELLIGLGVDSLSMSAVAIPAVHAVIATTRVSQVKRFASRVLAQTTVSDVRRVLERRFKKHHSLERYLSQLEADHKR